MQRNLQDDYSEENLAAHYQGLIKAVKFRGTYYKFDSESNTVDQLLKQLIPAGPSEKTTE